jgi:hypothetical protein
MKNFRFQISDCRLGKRLAGGNVTLHPTCRSGPRGAAFPTICMVVAMVLQIGARGQSGPLYVPEAAPVTFLWEHDRRLSSGATFYRFYAGTNVVQDVATNGFSILGVTNGVSTIEASITFSAALKGATNNLSVSAVEPNLSPPLESLATTNLLPAQVLGKPLPPQAPRKL